LPIVCQHQAQHLHQSMSMSHSQNHHHHRHHHTETPRHLNYAHLTHFTLNHRSSDNFCNLDNFKLPWSATSRSKCEYSVTHSGI